MGKSLHLCGECLGETGVDYMFITFSAVSSAS